MSRPSDRVAHAATLLYGAMALGFAVVVTRRLFDPPALAATDFTAFFTGWWLILHGRGGELYDVAAQRAAQHAITSGFQFHGGLLAFLHPPHAAVAGLPLGFVADRFGEPAAFWAWTAINVALAADLVRGVARLGADRLKEERWLIIAAAAAFFPLFATVREGQLAVLLAVATLRLFLATRDGRDATAAGWLLVLSFKPQLLPMPVALLLGLRRFRVLALTAVFGAAAAGVSAAILGPGVFGRYARGLGPLQAHLGSGAPEGMVNARGLVVRLAGAGQLGSQAVAFAICVVAALGVGVMVAQRRPSSGDSRGLAGAFAAAYAAGIFFSPHLFVPDLTLWVVPLALAASALPARTAGATETARFARFALAWPALYALALVLGVWPRLFLETATLLSVAGMVLLWRAFRRAPAGG